MTSQNHQQANKPASAITESKPIETTPLQTSMNTSEEQPQANEELDEEYYDEEYDPEVEEINDRLTSSAQRHSPKK